MTLVFWISVAFIAYVYVGYPLMLRLYGDRGLRPGSRIVQRRQCADPAIRNTACRSSSRDATRGAGSPDVSTTSDSSTIPRTRAR